MSQKQRLGLSLAVLAMLAALALAFGVQTPGQAQSSQVNACTAKCKQQAASQRGQDKRMMLQRCIANCKK